MKIKQLLVAFVALSLVFRVNDDPVALVARVADSVLMAGDTLAIQLAPGGGVAHLAR